MTESSKLAVVIAAGGTAGHVRPALAVAEALRARGASVTFAGSPDRVESQLVPEAGFELDTFAISGLPRKPSLELVRALVRAVKAPFACRAILRRRRPDVVLGGGGYVAGPMVLAARLSRIPAALTEADAHLGLANRLAAPFASKVFLAYEIPGRAGRRSRSSAGRSRPRTSGRAGRGARARFGLAAGEPVVAVFGALAGRDDAERDGGHGVGRRRPDGVARLRRAGLPRPRGSRAPARLRADAADGHFGDVLAAADVAVSRAGGTVWELAAAGHAVDPRPLPLCDRRPPDAERAPLRARWRGRRRPRTPRSHRARRSSGALLADPAGSPRCARRCSRWLASTPPTGSPRG